MDTSDHTSKPCYVYVIQAQSGACKIGIANHVGTRLSSLQTGSSEPLKLLYKLEFSDRLTAKAVEALLHQRYAGDSIRGEWFSIDSDRLIDDLRFASAFASVVRSVVTEVVRVPRTQSQTQPQYSHNERSHEQEVGTDEELYVKCVDLVRRVNKASASLLQRRFSIGYMRATRMIDLLYERGVIGGEAVGGQTRKVLPHED